MARPQLPTPAFPLQTLPTPQVADRVIVERYDHSLARFGPRNNYSAIPAYGVAHPDTRHFYGYRLVHIKLAEPDDWYDWYWVNDRVNQDAYNYEIEYPYGDIDYPRYTRTVLVRRAVYEALAFGTADSTEPTLLLVAEQTPRIGDEVLDSLYVLSKRVYERLPGLPITTWLVDGETQTPVKIVTQKVTKASGNYGTVPPVQSTGAAVEYRPINDYYGDLVTSTLDDYADVTRTELSDVQYEYPRIITAITPTSVELPGGQAKVTLHVVANANRRRTKQATTTITYNTFGNLTYDAPFNPALIDIIHDGFFLNIREQNVWLVPDVDIDFTTGTNNPIYGYAVESLEQAGQGAFPTGTQIISCRIRPWKYGLNRKEVTTIEL